MLPGAPAVQLYKCDDPQAKWCKRPAGKRCVDKDGKECPPHRKRWNLGQGYADAWNKRQVEIDEASDALDSAIALTKLQNGSIRDLTAEWTAAKADLATRDTRIAQLEKSNAALQQRIDELTRVPDPVPPASTFLVGAAVGGNADPAPLEKSLGKPLGVHRTYWGGSQVGKAVAVAKADLAAGRIPFLTFKLPFSWADMAAGKGDAWVKDLGAKLVALGGAVWLDFHHEPEGDGVAADWTAMQQRIIPLAASENVKVGVCYTGYQETHGDQTWTFEKTFPSEAQFLAVDIYQMYGTVNPKTGVRLTKWSPLEDYYAQVDTFAKKVGVPWGLGETGVTDEALAARPTALADLFAAARGNDGAFLAYFSSSLNSTGSWPLTGAKLDAFKELQ